MKHLPKALLLALLVGASGCSRQSISNEPKVTWEGHKAYFMGPGRHELMEICDMGRQMNELGLSAYSEQAQSGVRKLYSASNADAYFAGRAAAMAVVCPEVK